MYQNVKTIYLVFDNSKNIKDNVGFSIRNNNENFMEELKKCTQEKGFKYYDIRTENNSLDSILYEISINRQDTIVFITSKKDLFFNFARPIQLIQLDYVNKDFKYEDDFFININIQDIIGYIKKHEFEKLIKPLEFFFNRYMKIFDIDLETLTKKTTYSTKNKNNLIQLINEDLSLLKMKKILTSRLSIVLYRLFFFDLNAEKTAIGRYFKHELNVKSESYSFKSLNNNCEGFVFRDLHKKPFRGYKIPPLPQLEIKIEPKPHLFDEKINIARRLLKLKVKMKIVAEALEIEEKELNEIIYEEKGLSIGDTIKVLSPFDGLDVPYAEVVKTSSKNTSNILE